MPSAVKIKSINHLYEVLPEDERIIVDVLRQIIRAHTSCEEKISFNVPFFYGNRGVCLVYPSSIPRGGIKSGVLLGFWYGHQLKDVDNYLTRGTNKKIFYKIFQKVEEIDEKAIVKLLKEAIRLDENLKKNK